MGRAGICIRRLRCTRRACSDARVGHTSAKRDRRFVVNRNDIRTKEVLLTVNIQVNIATQVRAVAATDDTDPL